MLSTMINLLAGPMSISIPMYDFPVCLLLPGSVALRKARVR